MYVVGMPILPTAHSWVGKAEVPSSKGREMVSGPQGEGGWVGLLTHFTKEIKEKRCFGTHSYPRAREKELLFYKSRFPAQEISFFWDETRKWGKEFYCCCCNSNNKSTLTSVYLQTPRKQPISDPVTWNRQTYFILKKRKSHNLSQI